MRRVLSLLVVAILAAFALSACSASPASPVSPSSVAGVSSEARAAKATSVVFAIYAQRGYGDAQIDGYLVGAIVTVTTSAGVQTLTASGPLAKVKASVPASDTTIRVQVSYPGFCPYDRVLVVADLTDPWQVLSPTPGC